MKTLLIVAILSLACSAQVQTVVTEELHEKNHGGWHFFHKIGADQGDKITIDVRCDHDVAGLCFAGPPKLAEGLVVDDPKLIPMLMDGYGPVTALGPTAWLMPQGIPGLAFRLTKNEFQHQTWQTIAPSTGDLTVIAEYAWVGMAVHYMLHLRATEAPKL